MSFLHGEEMGGVRKEARFRSISGLFPMRRGMRRRFVGADEPFFLLCSECFTYTGRLFLQVPQNRGRWKCLDGGHATGSTLKVFIGHYFGREAGGPRLVTSGGADFG